MIHTLGNMIKMGCMRKVFMALSNLILVYGLRPSTSSVMNNNHAGNGCGGFVDMVMDTVSVWEGLNKFRTQNKVLFAYLHVLENGI